MIVKSLDNILIIAVVVVILFVGLVIILFERNARSSVFGKKKSSLIKELDQIKDTLHKDQIEPSMAVIRADTTFDMLLKYKYGQEGSMGDKLKLAKNFFRKDLYNSIWEAHKKRNKIVHENAHVTKEEANDIIYTFTKAINNL